MKSILNFLYLLSITLLISCDKDIERTNSCQDIQFAISFEIKVGESACLPDGRSIRLLEVRDEICPCFTDCFWEGQLVMKIETEDLNDNEMELEIGSGQISPNRDIFEDVTILDFTYLYNGTNDSLPLCEGIYDENKITLELILSQF